MARTPKAARDTAPAVPVRTKRATPNDTPLPERQGRKPKASAAPAELLVTMDSDDALAGSFDADGSVAAPGAKPARGRPGPKPKRPAADVAAAPVQEAKGKQGRKARTLDPAPEPLPAEDDALIAEMAFPVDEVGADPARPDGAGPDTPASDPAPPPASPVKPAAQWDRATDTVRFDWAEIERTAAQDGPNQVMAKLLIAARAEGAHSRWPL